MEHKQNEGYVIVSNTIYHQFWLIIKNSYPSRLTKHVTINLISYYQFSESNIPNFQLIQDLHVTILKECNQKLAKLCLSIPEQHS